VKKFRGCNFKPRVKYNNQEALRIYGCRSVIIQLRVWEVSVIDSSVISAFISV